MKIAIASGKGGTGKTTLSTTLALCADEPICLLDCDVEEPNSHFFIQPEIVSEKRVFSRGKDLLNLAVEGTDKYVIIFIQLPEYFMEL